MPPLLSVNVGLPRDVAWRGKTVRTAIWKTPVQGGRMVRRLNIEGGGQGDLAGHGGEHRAVFVYQIDSYRYWQSHGENDGAIAAHASAALALDCRASSEREGTFDAAVGDEP